MHCNVAEPQSTHHREHIRIILSCRNIIYDDLTYQIVSFPDNTRPPCIYRQGCGRVCLLDSTEYRLQPAPLLLLPYRNRSRPCRTCPYVYNVRALSQHLSDLEYSCIYTGTTAFSKVGIIRKVDDTHYIYMAVSAYHACKNSEIAEANEIFSYICLINQPKHHACCPRRPGRGR